MPRKPKNKPKTVTVVVNGTPVDITLHPPNGRQKTWYAYWKGLSNSKSTGQRNLQDAVATAENMLRNGGQRLTRDDTVLSHGEFEAIQRRHFSLRRSPEAMKRANKSLKSCLEAIDAFRRITGLDPVTIATPDDCARFQCEALLLPKSWRLTYPRARKTNVSTLSPNTVLKWSTALAAAFERANINAGKKCVRGVVDESRLLTANPWRQFRWIEGTQKPKRHLSDEELLSIIDYFENEWRGVSVAAAAAKTSIWAWARLSEMANLKWDDLRVVGCESHFQIVGKWGVEKWARLPEGLMEELRTIRVQNPFVFAAYNDQLRDFFRRTEQARFTRLVGDEFSATAFAGWFHERMADWSRETSHPAATPHTFRKTALQHARRGEDLNRQVAQDAKLSESVMMAHYVSVRDEELRQSSNRTYQRILLSLSLEVATRYGYRSDNEVADLERRLAAATGAKDWAMVQELAVELTRRTDRANCSVKGNGKPKTTPPHSGDEPIVSENI